MTAVLHLVSVPFVGGGEVSLLTVLPELQRLGYRSIVALPGEGPLAERVRALGLGVHLLDVPSPNTTRHYQPLATVRRALRLARRKQVTLVHVNSLPWAFVGGALGALGRVPVVLHLRDELPQGWPSGLRRLYTGPIGHYVAITQFVADALWQQDRARIVFNAVAPPPGGNGRHSDGQPPSVRAPAAPGLPRSGLPQAGPPAASPRSGSTVVTLGYLIPRKGLADLVEAASQVVRRVPTVRFRLVGEDPFPESGYVAGLKRRIGELRLDAHFEFPGFLPTWDALAGATVLAMPSWAEPFGRVALEASAAGLPVVACNAGGTPEAVVDDQTGLLVPPRNPGALAVALTRVLTDDALAERLGTTGRDLVGRAFTPQRSARALAKVFEEALRAGPRLW